uniref:Uncharacterized protein n=1 Tax=Romanomermis culicivorax TaxID=13658 RepID=A0A915K0M0_ROMCU
MVYSLLNASKLKTYTDKILNSEKKVSKNPGVICFLFFPVPCKCATIDKFWVAIFPNYMCDIYIHGGKPKDFRTNRSAVSSNFRRSSRHILAALTLAGLSSFGSASILTTE